MTLAEVSELIQYDRTIIAIEVNVEITTRTHFIQHKALVIPIKLKESPWNIFHKIIRSDRIDPATDLNSKKICFTFNKDREET